MTERARPYTSADLPDLLQLVAGVAAARFPGSAYMMTSDVGWQISAAEPEANVRLWYDDGALAGYGWFEPPTDVCFDVREDVSLASLLPEMLAWAEQRRRQLPPFHPPILECRAMRDWEALFLEQKSIDDETRSTLVTSAFDLDRERVALLETNGFRATGHFMPYLRRELDIPIPEPPLPEGARLRQVTEADFEERVAAHVDAWWPASGFDLQKYLAVRAVESYDPELDIVLETANGEFASYCIAWLDRRMGVGSFEPVGTRRRWRRQGIGRLVNYEGLRRLKARGMHTANIQTAGFNERAVGLYESCGFERIDTKRSYTKSV